MGRVRSTGVHTVCAGSGRQSALHQVDTVCTASVVVAVRSNTPSPSRASHIVKASTSNVGGTW